MQDSRLFYNQPHSSIKELMKEFCHLFKYLKNSPCRCAIFFCIIGGLGGCSHQSENKLLIDDMPVLSLECKLNDTSSPLFDVTLENLSERPVFFSIYNPSDKEGFSDLKTGSFVVIFSLWKKDYEEKEDFILIRNSRDSSSENILNKSAKKRIKLSLQDFYKPAGKVDFSLKYALRLGDFILQEKNENERFYGQISLINAKEEIVRSNKFEFLLNKEQKDYLKKQKKGADISDGKNVWETNEEVNVRQQKYLSRSQDTKGKVSLNATMQIEPNGILIVKIKNKTEHDLNIIKPHGISKRGSYYHQRNSGSVIAFSIEKKGRGGYFMFRLYSDAESREQEKIFIPSKQEISLKYPLKDFVLVSSIDKPKRFFSFDDVYDEGNDNFIVRVTLFLKDTDGNIETAHTSYFEIKAKEAEKNQDYLKEDWY